MQDFASCSNEALAARPSDGGDDGRSRLRLIVEIAEEVWG
jgi:hypothetical protein